MWEKHWVIVLPAHVTKDKAFKFKCRSCVSLHKFRTRTVKTFWKCQQSRSYTNRHICHSCWEWRRGGVEVKLHFVTKWRYLWTWSSDLFTLFQGTSYKKILVGPNRRSPHNRGEKTSPYPLPESNPGRLSRRQSRCCLSCSSVKWCEQQICSL